MFGELFVHSESCLNIQYICKSGGLLAHMGAISTSRGPYFHYFLSSCYGYYHNTMTDRCAYWSMKCYYNCCTFFHFSGDTTTIDSSGHHNGVLLALLL